MGVMKAGCRVLLEGLSGLVRPSVSDLWALGRRTGRCHYLKEWDRRAALLDCEPNVRHGYEGELDGCVYARVSVLVIDDDLSLTLANPKH
jgi:hypothetical protein